MQPTYLSLVKIFGSETRYTVPLFQRPYVWNKDDNWEPLWQDISDLADRVVSAPDDTQTGGISSERLCWSRFLTRREASQHAR